MAVLECGFWQCLEIVTSVCTHPLHWLFLLHLTGWSNMHLMAEMYIHLLAANLILCPIQDLSPFVDILNKN